MLLYPPQNEVVGGGRGILVASRVRYVAPAVLVGPIWYLYILWSNFRNVSRVKFLVKFQTLNFWQIFKLCNFDFVLFWLCIWCESLVWVIMRLQGVSQNAGALVVVLENSIYRAVWFVQMISSITSSDWGTCNSQWLTQNRTNLEMSNINFIWQIYMCIIITGMFRSRRSLLTAII